MSSIEAWDAWVLETFPRRPHLEKNYDRQERLKMMDRWLLACPELCDIDPFRLDAETQHYLRWLFDWDHDTARVIGGLFHKMVVATVAKAEEAWSA